MGNNAFSGLRENGNLPDPKSIKTDQLIQDIWQDYVDSATSLLPELEASAMQLEAGTDVDSNSANIKRILHCIKGESGMVGMMDIHDLCHEVESAFEEFADNVNQAADLVLKAKDWMNEAIEYIENGDSEEETEQATEPKPAPSVLPGVQQQEILKALVVDDAVVCRKRINMLLRNFFQVTQATNGAEGLERYKLSVESGQPFSLITMDINMPELDGHQALDAIRQFETDQGIEGLDGVKVIMTTSQGGAKHVMQAFRQGCEAYVVKANMGDKLLEEIAGLGLLHVKHYMVKEPLFVRIDTPVTDAMQLLTENPHSAIPVVDAQNKLKGIFSERDVLFFLNNSGDSSGTIESFYTKDVLSFTQEASLIEASIALTENHYRTAPVTDEGKLVGVIGRKQIISHILTLLNMQPSGE